MRSLFCALIALQLTALAAMAEPIDVTNHSFEYLNGVLVGSKTMGVTPDGWQFADGTPGGIRGGIENGSSDAGSVCLVIGGVDSVHQLLDYTIAPGDEYTLTFDAKYQWSSSVWDATFEGRLYYDDDGSREVLASVSGTGVHDGSWHLDYTVNTTVPLGSPAIGKQLGIELAVTDQANNSWFGFDNVRLDSSVSERAFGPDPSSGESEVSLSVDLTWQVTGQFPDPTFDVYFGDDRDPVIAGDASVFIGNQSELSYSPSSIQPATQYYWRIDIVDGKDLYPGTVWAFTTFTPLFDPYPYDHQVEVPRSVDLSWQVSDQLVSPTYNIYFGSDRDAVTQGTAAAFMVNRSETTYSPPAIQPATRYYWRIDVVEGEAIYPGPVWQFDSAVTQPQCLDMPADLDTDCTVDLTDLIIFANQWLSAGCSGRGCADIDETAGVGMSDFAILADNWAKPAPDIVINEFMARNTNVLSDNEGQFPDWIELKNLSEAPGNLKGWYLTDNIDNPTGWELPDVTIKAGDYLVIFASSKDRSDPALPLHTDFNLDQTGEYLALVRPDGTVCHEYRPEFPRQAENVSYGLTVPFGKSEFTCGYFDEPTPGAANSKLVSNLGPLIENVAHYPARPTQADDITVTAFIKESINPVESVTLHYRVMFENETAVAMFDDGMHNDASAGDGIYGAIIPAGLAAPGRMLRYYIATSDVGDFDNRSPLALDMEGMRQSPEYHGTIITDPAVNTELPVLYWFVKNTSAANTRTGTRASVFYDGGFYDNIFVRVRGGTISGLPKKSYKFEFNSGFYFRFSPDQGRVDEFNLNAVYPDKAYVRPVLSFETISNAGAPSSISFPVRVQRNGTFFSVAIFIEQPDGDYLKRQGLDPEGALYKMYNAMTSSSAEKKTRKYEDHSDLQSLVDGIALGGEARTRFVFDNLNIPVLINYAAAITITNDYDHGRKNYYAYRDTNGTGEWLYLPWDKDLTFGKMWSGSLGLLEDRLYYRNPWGGSAVSDTLQNGGNNALLGALFSMSRTRQMYYRRLRTLLDEQLQPPQTPQNELEYEARLGELYDRMVSDVTLDYNKWANPWPYGQDQSFAEAIEYLKSDFLVPRRTHVFQTVHVNNGGVMVDAQIPNPTINIGTIEFNPASGNQDEEYIKLINPNSFAVDISRWEITGGVRHTMLPGTVIPAGEILYVSPDVVAFRGRGTTPTGGEARFVQGNYSGHLSSWGEELNLLAADGTVVDTITSPADPSDQQRYLRVTEVMYHPKAPEGNSPYTDEDFEYIELKNIGNSTLDLAGVKITNGVIYDFPTGNQSTTNFSLIDITDSWRYDDTGTDLGTSWHATDYNDENWPQGPALLYHKNSGLPAPKNTPLVHGPNTYYFRTHFDFSADTATHTVTLRINTVIDDGAVFYLNGDEVYRLGMKDEPVSYSTLAGRTIGSAEYEGPFTIPSDSLVQGDNVLAVEVHQASATSSDIVFGITLDAEVTYTEPVESISLAPNGYVLVVSNPSAFAAGYSVPAETKIVGPYQGQLSNAGEEIKLEDLTNSTILEFNYNDAWFDITDGEGFSLTIKDPDNVDLDSWDAKRAWRPSAAINGSPGTDDSGIIPQLGDIVINELLAHSPADKPDWIELHNTTDSAISIGGWFVSDSATNLKKYEIDEGVSIPSGGFYVLYEDLHFGNKFDSGSHTQFALSENGETAYLTSGQDGVLTGYSNKEKFGPSESDVAFGRYLKSTGTYNFVAMSSNRPGQANAYPKVGPIVISEIMYHPAVNRNAEYVELLNISDEPVALYNPETNEPWKFEDDGNMEFMFPSTPVTIAANERILLVKDLPAFNSEFTAPAGTQIFAWGPTGSLDNAGEKIQLSMPGDVDNLGVRQYIRVDRVNYSDGSHPGDDDPWPAAADGTGKSLTRKVASDYGNDVINWQAAESKY